LPMPTKLPRGGHYPAHVIELRRLDLKDRMRIAPVIALEHRLVIKRIDLAHAAVHVQKNDVASVSGMMNAVRLRGAVVGSKRCEGDGAEAAGTGAQHVAAGHGSRTIAVASGHVLFLILSCLSRSYVQEIVHQFVLGGDLT